MHIFKGDNPTELYWLSIKKLVEEGQELAPRGKRIKEIRPAVFEFTDPLRRVTFLRGRLINPFFQLAESIWILSGYSDVSRLVPFNQSMAQFSDDGTFFHASYGERLRYWNKNDESGFVFNPIDQLSDVYEKIVKDTHTRQAVAIIYNPMFDNHSYTGKDTPCNIVLLFKVRNSKLDLTVVNRSNDISWGVFGANIVQFSTIQELMASWLSVGVGTYYQVTDSLHVYLDDYGAKCTVDILSNQANHPVADFQFPNAARITWDKEQTNKHLWTSIQSLYNATINDEAVSCVSDVVFSSILEISDLYFRDALLAMLAYRIYKVDGYNVGRLVDVLGSMSNSEWKVCCTRFLYNSKYSGHPLFEQKLIEDTWGDNEPLKQYIKRAGEVFNDGK